MDPMVVQTVLDATPREKSTVGGVAMWSGQFVKALSKTGSPGPKQWRVRIGRGGESSNRRNETAVNSERLLFAWPRGNLI